MCEYVDCEVIEISTNRFETTIHAPQAFYGAIIGIRGSVKKRIEGETCTNVIIPQRGSSGDITVTGTNSDAVRLASRQIKSIVIKCRRKVRPTHFTCIRILDSTVKTNFIKFKENMVKNGLTLGLKEDMFTEPDKLHFTIGVMCLMDDIDRSQAVELLNECRASIIVPFVNEYDNIRASICGVDIFDDEDPGKVRCIFGKIESEALQKIADAILKRFIDAGLSKREYGRDNVKLHMTLIKVNSRGTTLDARHILENYSKFEFGVQQINQIHLAIISTKDTDGFYKCVASIEFPAKN